MKPRINRRHALSAVLLLFVSVIVFFFAWPAAKLVMLKASMPQFEIPTGTDRYDAKLRYVFKEAYTPETTLRCLSTGGMMEMVVFVKGNQLFLLQTLPGSSLWNHEYREMILDGEISGSSSTGKPLSQWSMVSEYEKVPVSLDDYPLHRRSAPITDDLLAEIKAIWLDALEHAERKKSPRIGLDGGTNTYFFRTDDGLELAGSIWSPSDGPAAALNNVTFALSMATHGESGARYIKDALSSYWKEAQNRASASQELDYNESPLARRSSR